MDKELLIQAFKNIIKHNLKSLEDIKKDLIKFSDYEKSHPGEGLTEDDISGILELSKQ